MQGRLDIQFPELEGFGEPKESEPLFWIKELRVLSKWGAGKECEIRRIQFRKGLNVIWSPPTDVGVEADQRISGHASGKTTLCRLIRYVLGEQKIGTESFRNAVTHKFVEGFVAAEIRLAGETWSVARPFTAFTSSKGFAQKGGVLDEFFKVGHEPGTYDEFKIALEQTSKRIVSLDRLPDESPLTLWHYFPWFTRDQEAQFLKLYAWRENTSSEADSPMLKQDQKAFIMRSIFDPAAADELDLITEHEHLNVSIEDAQKDEVKYDGACEADREWLSRFPVICDVDLENELFVQAWQVKMTNAKVAVQSTPIEVSTKKALLEDEVMRARRKLDDAQDELSQLEVYYRTQYRKLNDLEKSAKATITQPPPPEDRVQAATHLRPDDRFCRVPIWVAQQKGCRVKEEYAKELGDTQAQQRTLHEKVVESIDGQKNLISDLTVRRKTVSAEIDEFNMAYAAAIGARDEYNRVVEQETREKEREMDDAMSAVSRYQSDLEKLQKIRRDIEVAKNKRKDIGAKLNALHRSREVNVSITDYFLRVVEFVLGENVVGKVTVDRDSIKLECDYNDANYTSAALNAAYNVMFDIAVMVMGIQGKSTHPRFLLHDGPRVADVSPSIYHRYFELAEDLERRANGNPNFQYIITTTEPPPEKFCSEPYLRLKLDAATPEGRLLKCDLG